MTGLEELPFHFPRRSKQSSGPRVSGRPPYTPTTLASLEGRLYARHPPLGGLRWILPLGVYHRTRRRNGLQVSPYSLSQQAYYRLEGRLSLFVCCVQSGRKLLEACPECRSPIIPHRLDISAELSKSFANTSALSHCFACDFDLARAETESVSSPVLSWQREVHAALFEDRGTIFLQGTGLVPLLEYLSVIRVWLNLMTFSRGGAGLRALLSLPEPVPERPKGFCFDHLNLESRLRAMTCLTTLLEGWPHRLLEWAEAAGIRYYTLIQDLFPVPDWYQAIVLPLRYKSFQVQPRSRNGAFL